MVIQAKSQLEWELLLKWKELALETEGPVGQDGQETEGLMSQVGQETGGPGGQAG